MDENGLKAALGVSVSVIASEHFFSTFESSPVTTEKFFKTDEDKAKNKIIAHTRARVEHIFGYMTRFMAGITSGVHGIDRVKRDITAKNLAYNIKRYVCIAG